jgi:uncharacterized protein YecE (DUF72 family)
LERRRRAQVVLASGAALECAADAAHVARGQAIYFEMEIAPGCDVRIGTSGWHYKHWVGTYYPPTCGAPQMLEHYLRDFDTVELNNSFYRLPTPEAFECWRHATPPDFRFAVKGSRYITHNKKLKDPENALENLLPRAERLGRKLGVVLWQLPPKWRKNVARLDEFLAMLPRKHHYAFEFREPSWLSDDVLTMLARYHAAFCIYELAGFHTAFEITAEFVYVRLHGPGAGKYQGSYSEAQLGRWAERIADWSRRLKAVYVYFDNDQHGYAAHNAKMLKRMVGERGLRRAA